MKPAGGLGGDELQARASMPALSFWLSTTRRRHQGLRHLSDGYKTASVFGGEPRRQGMFNGAEVSMKEHRSHSPPMDMPCRLRRYLYSATTSVDASSREWTNIRSWRHAFGLGEVVEVGDGCGIHGHFEAIGHSGSFYKDIL